jgi:predicted metal-dependent phosphoesterase TrpH
MGSLILKDRMPLFNIDFHHHCSSDPVDRLFYDDYALIDQAVLLGLHTIAITPHRTVYDNPAAVAYAQSKSLLLIPGVEKMIEGREIVLLNVTPSEVPDNFNFEDLSLLREKRGDSLFVFAPHPFYPRSTCAGPVLDKIVNLIDAVEYAHLYFCFYNRPNEKAVEWAEANNKAVLANSDSHHLDMVGRNATRIEADKLDVVSIFRTLKATKGKYSYQPYSLFRFLRFFFFVCLPLEFFHTKSRFFRALTA